MKDWLAELLQPLADTAFAIVMSVPLPMVRWIFLGILAVLAIWALTLPPQRPEPVNGKEPSILTDLRLYAVGLLALQSVFYIIF